MVAATMSRAAAKSRRDRLHTRAEHCPVYLPLRIFSQMSHNLLQLVPAFLLDRQLAEPGPGGQVIGPIRESGFPVGLRRREAAEVEIGRRQIVPRDIAAQSRV